MKKILMVVAALCMVSAMFAVDFSIGARAGLGGSILRGAEAEDFKELLASNVEEFNLAYTVGIDALIEFTPFFALETGIGIIGSGVEYSTGEPLTALYIGQNFQRGEIYIPVMARVQTEYDIGSIGGVSYFSLGAQIGISITSEEQGYMFTRVGKDYTETKISDASPINIDIPVAIGQEFRFGSNHYVGLRAQYNINLTSPIEPPAGLNPSDWFHDSIMGSITYRYAF